MVYHHNFKFKINNHTPEENPVETIYLAQRHDAVYDVYVVNGLEYHRERVAALVDKGEWILI